MSSDDLTTKLAKALPPLPGATCHGFVGEDTEDLFTADQMHAYARAALAANVPADLRKLIEQCRDALAEELGAWDIDPPLFHVKEAHDACVAWLSATPPAPAPDADLLRRLLAHGAVTASEANGDDMRLVCTQEQAAKVAPAYVGRTVARMLPGAVAMGWISDAERKDVEEWLTSNAME